MKKLAIALSLMGTAIAVQAAKAPAQADIYQQSYALYLLYHPDVKAQSTKALVDNYKADYAPLFNGNTSVNKAQFVQYEQARLAPVLEKRREMSLKQTHVRYGILDKSKDQKLTLKEFQETGLKSFDEWDKNQDGIVNEVDAALADSNKGTHDGFRVRLPISMPMPSNTQEFIQQYGQGKNYVTLGDYLTARDKQYFATDLNGDNVVTEEEYTQEFMQRYDQNNAQGKEKMNTIFAQQFDVISNGKNTIQLSNIEKFAKKIDKTISQ